MKISVVIPTTRPHLVRNAIMSVEGQSIQPYEIVVSDNSDNGCLSLLKSIGLNKIKYFRPERILDVSAHWDYAISKASGDWIIVLCDDDAVIPCALEVINEIYRLNPYAEVIKWQKAYLDVNSLRIGGFRTELDVYDAHALKAAMFDSGSGKFGIKESLPTFPLICVRTEVLAQLRRKTGGPIFFPMCPMTSGALGILDCTKSVTVSMLPLTILQFTVDSASNFAHNPEIAKTMQKGTEFHYAPIKHPTIFPSGSIEAMFRMAVALQLSSRDYKIDIPKYFIHCNYFLSTLRKKGGEEVTKQWGLFNDALSSQPKLVRIKYYVYLAKVLIAQLSPMRFVRLLLSFYSRLSINLSTASPRSCDVNLSKKKSDLICAADDAGTLIVKALEMRPLSIPRKSRHLGLLIRKRIPFKMPSDFSIRIW
jgi:glycosyltransferase involved in cell wall biosynthesis